VSLHKLSIGEARRLLRKGDITPVDIAEDLIRVVEARDRRIGAYLDFYQEELLERAVADTQSGSYRDRPLGGIPIAVKDNICVKGKRTTCGSRMLRNYKSLFTATAVERLEDAGAIVAGKSNCDEFAMGSSNEHSSFGPVLNPWNTELVPGGSSGGSAAAVAGYMAFGALGSDTGGSIRQPASFCGVVGLKPTYGRISRSGLVAFASSFDQIGPLARTVEDTAALFHPLCAKDNRDSTSISVPAPCCTDGLERGLEGLTLGVPRRFLHDGMDGEVRASFDELVRRLETTGVAVHDVDLPHADCALAAYYIIANAEASANLARYDGVKYGHRSEHADDLYKMYTNTRGEGFGAEVKRRILLGTFVLSAGYYDAYYLKAQKVRSLIVRDFRSAFETCDLVLLPTSPTPPFALGEKTGDPLSMYASDVYTVLANLAGLPAISVPIGVTADRRPIGGQLIGPALGEDSLLRGAWGIESLVDVEECPIE
jgi:aspartyl-tRNA(Asn)/glutamyl-tRNA(Gln) amidotransferase subunit A